MKKLILSFAPFFAFSVMAGDFVSVGGTDYSFNASIKVCSVEGTSEELIAKAKSVLEPYLFYDDMKCTISLDNDVIVIACPQLFIAPFYANSPHIARETREMIKKRLIQSFFDDDV
jgi:hypothetical protein